MRSVTRYLPLRELSDAQRDALISVWSDLASSAWMAACQRHQITARAHAANCRELIAAFGREVAHG